MQDPGFWLEDIGSGRSRPLPVYWEPDKTLKSFSAEPQNLQPLKNIIRIIGAGRDQKSRIRFLFENEYAEISSHKACGVFS